MSDAAQLARQAEVDELIRRALDPSDPYDGHHGNDRSPESVEYAHQHNPDLAARLVQKIATGAKE